MYRANQVQSISTYVTLKLILILPFFKLALEKEKKTKSYSSIFHLRATSCCVIVTWNTWQMAMDLGLV